MLDKLKNIDNALLLFINHHHTPFFDGFMMMMSNRFVWIPLYLGLALLAFRKYGWRSLLLIVCAGLAVAMSDQLASHLVKNLVKRYRPSHNLVLSQQLHYVNNYLGGLYGFASSHAANTVALALFLTLAMPRMPLLSVFLFCWVGLVCYSRMYLGVHYPSDIAGGAIIGAVSALVMSRVYNLIRANAAQSK